MIDKLLYLKKIKVLPPSEEKNEILFIWEQRLHYKKTIERKKPRREEAWFFIQKGIAHLRVPSGKKRCFQRFLGTEKEGAGSGTTVASYPMGGRLRMEAGRGLRREPRSERSLRSVKKGQNRLMRFGKRGRSDLGCFSGIG